MGSIGHILKIFKLLKSNKHKFLIHFLFIGTLPDLMHKYYEKPTSFFFFFFFFFENASTDGLVVSCT